MDAVSKQWLTLSLIVAIALFTILSDVLLIRAYGPDASYNRVVAHIFAAYPVVGAIVLVSLGILIGHVWLPTRP